MLLQRQPCMDGSFPLCLFWIYPLPEVSMLKMNYALLVELNSRLQADLLESYLEAHSIDAELFQESIGWHIYPVAIDGLGSTQVFVPKTKLEDAGKLYNE